MLENSKKTQTTIEELCKKLHCLELAEDLERVNHARDLLSQLQQSDILRRLHTNSKKYKKNLFNYPKLSDLLLKTKQRLNKSSLKISSSDGTTSDESIFTLEESELPNEEYEMESSSIECENLSNDNWLGYFQGYDILTEIPTCTLSENKQCIELSLKDDGCSLETYLREGIHCFLIDLSFGTDLEKQKLIFHLRESELKISNESGFPCNTTLIGLLSPRLQYTGVMANGGHMEKLEKGHNLILTAKRKHSANCTSLKVYVNARFLLEDCKEGDIILIGPALQLMITDVLAEKLKCVVVESGLLSSRLPVRFPVQCHRSEISLEELEDITFAREVGIKILMSYKPGSIQYLNDLYDIFDLLKYDDVKLCTRLVLNDYEDDVITDIEWIAKCYEGFLVEINFQQYNKCGRTEAESSLQFPNILQLTSTCWCLMEKLFQQKKPIILNTSLIAERQLYVQSQNAPHIFQFPDKFLFSKESLKHKFDFFLLQRALTENMQKIQLPIQRLCDTIVTGDEKLAAACVAVSFQSPIKAIIVCSAWPVTAINMSHFRPEVPVIFVSPTKLFGDYILLYHNLIYMPFQTRCEYNYVEYVTNAFLFTLIYMKSIKILCDGESVLLVYATNSSIQFCDNYLIFKFIENNFISNLRELLFE